jgi:hypothetical protein
VGCRYSKLGGLYHQNEYRKARETGELVDDADLQNVETTIIDDQDEEEVEIEEEVDVDSQQDEQEESHEDVEDEDVQLTPQEKTAFQKRLEREQKKIEEKLRSEMDEQYKQKYSKHDEAIQLMGGDPEKILSVARETQMKREAQQLADQNGWDEEQTHWYLEQQKKDQRLQELEVSVQINDLKDRPEYAGIGSMKQSIIDKIKATRGALNVEEAYWALGGPKRIEQVKLEAQQREIAKRQAPTRTVQRDTASSTTGEKPLPPSVLKEAERMGISAEEARRIMSKPISQNIDEYRKNKAK